MIKIFHGMPDIEVFDGDEGHVIIRQLHQTGEEGVVMILPEYVPMIIETLKQTADEILQMKQKNPEAFNKKPEA